MAGKYVMRISRQIVDQVGVKLYDKVSAVLAELISNAYDADATAVKVHAPMGEWLAPTRSKPGTDHVISVEDNGTGMDPDQVQEFFLVVGSKRRLDGKRGEVSPIHNRKVMGRKGLGKLAPFGICNQIEVISSGGKKTKNGYLTSHVLLDYGLILSDKEENYEPESGELDKTYRKKTGTTVLLKKFNRRRVPEMEMLERELAQRFGIQAENWKVKLHDNASGRTKQVVVGEFECPVMAGTQIMFCPEKAKGRQVIGPDNKAIPKLSAGFSHNRQFLKISGWAAYSKKPYKDELMAGIRIYCRGKIAAQTTTFEHKAGFTGEHRVRSYLVGEIHADWLDEKDDLIQTDRRDILWSDELGSQFKQWGQSIVGHIGKLAEGPARMATNQVFFETGDVAKRINSEYPETNRQYSAIREQAIRLANVFGKAMSLSDAKNSTTVNEHLELCINLAPHLSLSEQIVHAAESSDTSLSALSKILHSARFAELSSFGRIAEKRVKVIHKLEQIYDREKTTEAELQKLLQSTSWLINPEWSPVTANQQLNTLKKKFIRHHRNRTGETLSLPDFEHGSKRPDFVLFSQDRIVQIVEIKAPGHKIANKEMNRLISYYQSMDEFLGDPRNEPLSDDYRGIHITLVCDDCTKLDNATLVAFDSYRKSGYLTVATWQTLLRNTGKVHEEFVKEESRQRSIKSASRD